MTKVLTSPLSSRNLHSVPVRLRVKQGLTQEFGVQTGCPGSSAFFFPRSWGGVGAGGAGPRCFISAGSRKNLTASGKGTPSTWGLTAGVAVALTVRKQDAL